MSYTNLIYHIVYATKVRAPLITKTLRPHLHEYLGGTVRGLGGVALEVNGTADHVHILAKLRPTLSVSESLSKLKSGYDFRSRLVHGDEKLLEQKIYVGHLRDGRNLARRTLVWFLRYLDYVQRRYLGVRQTDRSLPTRQELLAPVDLRADSRERISRLLNILPDNFPRSGGW